MNKRNEWYVAFNTVPDKRTGMYLLIHRGESDIAAFGLSHADAIRAQKNGASFIGRPDAEQMIAEIN